MKTVCADLISLSPFFKMQKKIAVDETLWRVYFGSYKSPLTTRAGLPHRRIFEFRNVLILLSNCPCNYSLLSFRKLLKDCFTVQSINSDGIFSLQKKSNPQSLLILLAYKIEAAFFVPAEYRYCLFLSTLRCSQSLQKIDLFPFAQQPWS